MNRLEEILTVLQEECGEVIQASTKIIRFGTSASNKQHLINELGDVMGVLKMLQEEIKFDPEDLIKRADQKIAKAESFMNNKKSEDL